MMTSYQSDPRLLASRILLALTLLVTMVSCTLLPQDQGGTEGLTAELTLYWHREGGIAGFCDDLTITLPTSATVSSCRSEPATTVGEVELTTVEQAALSEWLDTYSTDTYEMSDPATADSMTIAIEFYGHGDQALDEAAWQQINRFAQQLVGRARS